MKHQHPLLSTTLALLLALPPAALRADFPTPSAATAPADSLAVLSFKGSHHLGPAYDTSHLKAVLDASSFPQFYHDLLPQLLKKSLDTDPGSAHTLATSLTALEILGRQGFSVHVRPAPVNDLLHPFLVGLTCDAGPEADALEKLFRSLATADPSEPLLLRRTGTTLSLSTGRRSPTTAPAAPDPLSTSPAFTAALKQVDPDPVLLLYVDFNRILPLIDQASASDGPANPWPKIKPITGLAGLHRYVLTGSFSPDGGWSTQSFTDATAPRTGWLALARGNALPTPLLSRIPADATYVRTGHFDPAGWVDNAPQIAAAAGGPQAQQKFDQILGFANLYVGRNLTADILAPLGTDFAIYMSPVTTPANQPYGGAILLAKVSDDAKVSGGFTSLFYALANTTNNPQVRATNIHATAAQDTFDGVKVTYLKLSAPNPQFAALSPAFAIKDSYLYLGLSPQSVAAAANYAGPTFPDSPTLAQAEKLLPPHAPETSLEFATVQPQYYQNLHTAVDMLLGIASINGVKLSANPLPPAAALTPHLRPLLRVSWSDADGFHSRSTSPFPGSSFLTPSGLSSIGVASLGASVALPSLNRAREVANRVTCATNMKQIGLAISLYAREHQGHYPPDLGTLVATEDIGADAFRCPDSNTPRITDRGIPAGELLTQLPSRVNTQTDYTYVGQSFTQTTDPHTLVLFEKVANHYDGCNLLFADGSVQFFVRKDADRIIAAGKCTDQDMAPPTLQRRSPARGTP